MCSFTTLPFRFPLNSTRVGSVKGGVVGGTDDHVRMVTGPANVLQAFGYPQVTATHATVMVLCNIPTE